MKIKLSSRVRKLIEKNSLSGVIDGVLRTTTLDKLLMEFSNQCIFRANAEKVKKRKASWYKMARVFHRACDEMTLEKTKKHVFKVARRDIYLCPKCKKKFKVDYAKEENCKFELDRGLIVVKCPNCSFCE
jgi:DNA-directed RNA polymerase subunit RPC12/RpoP